MESIFRQTYMQHIKREGAAQLLEWLASRDFFDAPASTRFHGSHPGGLCQHSLNVFDTLRSDPRAAKYSDETIAIVALLHDLCKVNFYSVEYRNRKNERGQWEQYPFYIVDDRFPYGHGEKSVYIISQFMRLSAEEAMAIRWHMDAYDATETQLMALNAAKEKYPLIMLLHYADDYASKALDRAG